ncbi:MAG: DUF5320 domain-containing protein [Candidatus Aminicenantes bacterium]|nr:DUF5320 domain-containing protein [Candidatus Aminicenantes bacterium]
MPGGDRTGPWGAGPRTGRAMGYCSGYSVPGYMNPGPGWGRGFGRGYGMGRGGGRGWGRWGGTGFWGMPSYPYNPSVSYAPPTMAGSFSADEEKAALEEQAKFMRDQLNQIQNRLEELAKEKKTQK